MNYKSWFRICAWVALIAIGGALVACASPLTLGSYSSFGFDMRKDSQDAVVLDYHYGNDKYFLSPPESAVKRGQEMYFESVGNLQYRVDFLFVKWRNKSTGKLFEETADLRGKLPKNPLDYEVYFMIRDDRLFVYLISPDRRPPETPIVGPHMYRSQKVTTIYPDQIKP